MTVTLHLAFNSCSFWILLTCTWRSKLLSDWKGTLASFPWASKDPVTKRRETNINMLTPIHHPFGNPLSTLGRLYSFLLKHYTKKVIHPIITRHDLKMEHGILSLKTSIWMLQNPLKLLIKDRTLIGPCNGNGRWLCCPSRLRRLGLVFLRLLPLIMIMACSLDFTLIFSWMEVASSRGARLLKSIAEGQHSFTQRLQAHHPWHTVDLMERVYPVPLWPRNHV